MSKITAFAIFATIVTTSAIPASAAQAKIRTGVVTVMEPIENRGDDVTQGTKAKKNLGAVAGMLAGSKVGGAWGAAGGAAAGQVLAPKIGGRPASTHYMVKIKLDSGRVLTVTQLRVNLNGIDVGSRVNVDGSGDSAKLSPAG